MYLQWANGLITVAWKFITANYGEPAWLLHSIMYRAVHILTN